MHADDLSTVPKSGTVGDSCLDWNTYEQFKRVYQLVKVRS
jgi:hypothetical protein